MAKKYRECPYKHCMLPRDNGKFFWQFLFLFFSLCMVVVHPDNLTFIAIVLFVVPVGIDLIYWENKKGWTNCIKRAFVLLNVFLFMVGVLGQFGLFVDNGSDFCIVESALILSGASFTKKFLACSLVPDLLVPVVMGFSSPNQSYANAHMLVRRALQEGGQKNG